MDPLAALQLNLPLLCPTLTLVVFALVVMLVDIFTPARKTARRQATAVGGAGRRHRHRRCLCLAVESAVADFPGHGDIATTLRWAST